MSSAPLFLASSSSPPRSLSMVRDPHARPWQVAVTGWKIVRPTAVGTAGMGADSSSEPYVEFLVRVSCIDTRLPWRGPFTMHLRRRFSAFRELYEQLQPAASHLPFYQEFPSRTLLQRFDTPFLEERRAQLDRFLTYAARASRQARAAVGSRRPSNSNCIQQPSVFGTMRLQLFLELHEYDARAAVAGREHRARLAQGIRLLLALSIVESLCLLIGLTGPIQLLLWVRAAATTSTHRGWPLAHTTAAAVVARASVHAAAARILAGAQPGSGRGSRCGGLPRPAVPEGQRVRSARVARGTRPSRAPGACAYESHRPRGRRRRVVVVPVESRLCLSIYLCPSISMLFSLFIYLWRVFGK